MKSINLSIITSPIPLTPGWFVFSCWAFSPWMWDKLGSIAWNSFHLQTFPGTFHTANLSDLVSTWGYFFPCGFVNTFFTWGRRDDGCIDIFRIVHTRVEFTMWVSLWLDVLSFLWGSCSEHDLSNGMAEKRNSTPCPMNAGIDLLLYCPDLVSMQYIVEVGGRVWMQANPELVVPCVLQFLEKLKQLVSILNCPWRFVNPSLHLHWGYGEDTLQTAQFVCCEVNPKRPCWCARLLCCEYPHFQKIWECRLVVYLQVNCYCCLCASSPAFLTISP